MKLIRTILIVASVVTIQAVQAATVRVAVGYGNAGSHGSYICYLYKGGYLYDVKWVRNTGFASGVAEFDVPRSDKYFGYVICTTNGRSAVSNGAWFDWWRSSLNLTAQFS